MTRLTSDYARRIVGRENAADHVIAELVATKASEDTLVEAYNWFVRGDAVGAEAMRSMGADVARLYAILKAAADDMAPPEAP